MLHAVRRDRVQDKLVISGPFLGKTLASRIVNLANFLEGILKLALVFPDGAAF